MRFFHTLRQDLNKTMLNAGFGAAALLTCLLCFTAGAYYDPAHDKSYSVFEALSTLDRPFIEAHEDFASIRLFSNGLSGYVSMFLPIIVAFPFMLSFCAERTNGLMRFTISRSGRVSYYLSKFCASFISGGAAVAIGYALFGVLMLLIFPSVYSYGLDPEQLEWIIPDGQKVAAARAMASAFTYGAFSTLPAFFISSFCRNPYIITCLPFMLTYVWSTAINKAAAKAFEQGDFGIYEKLIPYMPDSPRQIAFMDFEALTEQNKTLLIFNGIYFFALLLGFAAVMELRRDKGA